MSYPPKSPESGHLYVVKDIAKQELNSNEISAEKRKELEQKASSLLQNNFKILLENKQKFDQRLDKNGEKKVYLLGEKSLQIIQKLTNYFLETYKDLTTLEFEYLSNQVALKVNATINANFNGRKENMVNEKEPLLVLTQALKNTAGLKSLQEIQVPQNGSKMKVSIVIPVYGEKERTLPYDKEKNPNGQNAVFQKLKQIEILSDANSNIEYEVIYLDDGDKKGSEEAILPRLNHFNKINNNPNITTKYVKLAELIDSNHPNYNPQVKKSLGRITDASDSNQSQKGGAVKAGILISDGKLVLVTDADLEMHVEQMGSGIAEIIKNPERKTVSMSRRTEFSNQIKTQEGDFRGKFFIALRRSLTGSSINDSQQTLILNQRAASGIIQNEMSDKASNSPAYPAILLAHAENKYGQKSVEEKPAQFNADGSASNFDSGAYVKILYSTLESLCPQQIIDQLAFPKKTSKEDLKNAGLAKTQEAIWASKIVIWAKKNPKIFTEKMKEFANPDFNLSNLDVLKREPYQNNPSLREIKQIAEYFGVNLDKTI